MTKLYKINNCSEKQRKIVLELSRETFLAASGEEGTAENLKHLQEQLENNHVLTASIKDKLVGFAAYDFACDDDYHRNDFIERDLGYARNKSKKDFLLKHLKELQKEYGGEAFVEYFENVFTQTDKIDVHDKDMLLTHISVVPNFRRMGIAQALTEAKLKIAEKEGSIAVYVNCWEAGMVSKLYEKLGFHSIIRAGPSYCDGSAMRMMGLILP